LQITGRVAARLGAVLLASGAVALLFLADPIGLRNGAVITVENDATPVGPLRSVEVSVQGDVAHMGEIPPGEPRTARLHPRGESGVTLRFVLQGAPIAATGGYVEDSPVYRMALVVREGGGVFVRPCFGPSLSCDGPASPLRQ
jgi:hypothetical protein